MPNCWLVTHDKPSEHEACTNPQKGRRPTKHVRKKPEHLNTTNQHGTHLSANNRWTASQSIIRQMRPSWHHCQDTVTKVSPSVTERWEVTTRVPYQKVLRAKPALGHTPTHKPGHETPEAIQVMSRPLGRRDTIAMGKGTVTPAIS
ncbi:hypothetical protein Taro_009163 [Colocasia esculenta]|uniref:Uncharacterized protein n=1 Tax=Colocasia esculenta TaxID=4460 RepID=A0A843U5M8_COLES|nr:hypothetical protein [Colocasia esculenta]